MCRKWRFVLNVSWLFSLFVSEVSFGMYNCNPVLCNCLVWLSYVYLKYVVYWQEWSKETTDLLLLLLLPYANLSALSMQPSVVMHTECFPLPKDMEGYRAPLCAPATCCAEELDRLLWMQSCKIGSNVVFKKPEITSKAAYKRSVKEGIELWLLLIAGLCISQWSFYFPKHIPGDYSGLAYHIFRSENSALGYPTSPFPAFPIRSPMNCVCPSSSSFQEVEIVLHWVL